MSLHIRLQLIRQFLKGHTTPKAEDVINNWYYSIDDTVVPELWQEQGKKERMMSLQLAKLMDRIQGLQERRIRVVAMRRRAVWAAAAVVTGITVILGARYFLSGHQEYPVLQYSSIKVPLGKIKRIALPDSSVVWLKSGTTFRYNNRYGYTNREVDLTEGEAWFDVRKDDQRPFVVNTGRLRTRVLGTAFNVQAYRDNPVIQIWVDHGSVQVSDSSGVLGLLTQNHRLQWNRTNGYCSTDSLRWRQALAWQKGILLLESASFDELAFQLKEIYGSTIVTQDPVIRRQLYDAKFFIRTPFRDVLQTISEVHHIHFKLKNDQVLFY